MAPRHRLAIGRRGRLKVRRPAGLLLLFQLIAFSPANASEAPGFFHHIGENALDSVSGSNLLLHGGAVGSTAFLSATESDFHIHNLFAGKRRYPLFAAGVGWGGAAPLLVGLPLYLDGRSDADEEEIGAAQAVFQAGLLALGYITLYKAITGRPNPSEGTGADVLEESLEFNFGFLREGVFFGWPSGHAATSAAVLSALMSYYPDKEWLAAVSAAATVYMIVTVSGFRGGQMHWFSDGVAGTLVGYAVGTTVGRDFRKAMDGEAGGRASWRVLPIASAGAAGIGVRLEVPPL